MAGETVSIICNIPNGVYLHIDEMQEASELVMGGGSRTIKRAYPRPGRVHIFGPATPFGQAPKALVVGGYAITPNVDKEFWDAWIKQNAESDMVKNNCIRAYQKADGATGWAKEHAECESGMQPLKPDGDPRRPKPSNPNLTITTATERV